MLGTLDNYKIIPQVHIFQLLHAHDLFSGGGMFIVGSRSSCPSGIYRFVQKLKRIERESIIAKQLIFSKIFQFSIHIQVALVETV